MYINPRNKSVSKMEEKNKKDWHTSLPSNFLDTLNLSLSLSCTNTHGSIHTLRSFISSWELDSLTDSLDKTGKCH